MKRQLLALIGIAVTSIAGATSDVSNTTIIDVAINRDYGNFVLIKVASPPVSPASCSTNGGWHYTLPLSDQASRDIYAMLLSALASGATVDVSGLGSCNEWVGIESLRSLRVSGR